jgi:hypothetical protein
VLACDESTTLRQPTATTTRRIQVFWGFEHFLIFPAVPCHFVGESIWINWFLDGISKLKNSSNLPDSSSICLTLPTILEQIVALPCLSDSSDYGYDMGWSALLPSQIG